MSGRCSGRYVSRFFILIQIINFAFWQVMLAMCSSSRSVCRGYSFPKTSYMSYWLVLVRGYAGARDRPCSGRGTSARRPLYLPASDRVVSDRSLGCSRLRSIHIEITVLCSQYTAAAAIVAALVSARLFRPLIGKIARHFGRTLWPSPSDNDFAHNNLGYLCCDAESWTKRFRILIRRRTSGQVMRHPITILATR